MSTNNHADFAHHFESREHEHETSKLGVWLFLATEILMFGGLFVAFFLFRNLYPEAWKEGSALLSVGMGALNTVVLITSSFTMALAVHYTQRGMNDVAFKHLLITIACAAGFMVVKYFEYTHKIHAGTLPGGSYFFAGQSENLPLFFGVYFIMTGLHGLHILVGIGLITWLAIRNRRGDFSASNFTAVEGVGLYWHIVDIIWIFLFPLLYLNF